MKYESIISMARDTCIFDGDSKFTKLPLYIRALTRAAQELNLYLLPSIKSDFFTVADNLTIKLPDSVEGVIKVGVVNSRNTIVVLGVDERKLKGSTIQNASDVSSCGCKVDISDMESDEVLKVEKEKVCSACTFHNYSYNGNLGECYGYRPAKFPNGRYYYDITSNTINLYSGYHVSSGSKLLVEYKSNDDADLRMLPTRAFMTLRYRAMQILNEDKNLVKASYSLGEFKRNWAMLKRTFINYSMADLVNSLRGVPKNVPNV